MTAPASPSLFDIPAVQDAVNYALQQMADWQLVPQRVSRDESALVTLEPGAREDAGVAAQLAVLRRGLEGVLAEYTAASPQVASVINAARVLQQGGSVSGGTIVDAAKLTTTMAANLGALAQIERQIQNLGGDITVGPGGGFHVPSWVKWGLIGLGVYWFLGWRRRG